MEIAVWTIVTFGTAQAEIYEGELIARCRAIALGLVTSRDCSVLVGRAAGRFARAGEHFVIFIEAPGEVAISRSDLPSRLAALEVMGGG